MNIRILKPAGCLTRGYGLLFAVLRCASIVEVQGAFEDVALIPSVNLAY